ncbi:MAG: hypothetical protein ACREFP_16090 [Acetobacteraceae bacterium]
MAGRFGATGLVGSAGLIALLFASAPLWAQRPRGPIRKPMAAEKVAPADLTGYWVSLITQDWRFRMVVPGRGEYAAVPINIKGKQFADAWRAAPDEAAGKQCEAYGAAVLMRNPEQLHITWQDANTLRVDTDAGMQTRLLHFLPPRPRRGPPAPFMAPHTNAPPSWQGQSVARWPSVLGGELFSAAPAANAPRADSFEVMTDDMLPGLLRKNGVPYGSKTTMHEWWQLYTEPTGEHWLTISTKVFDPEYLSKPYLYESIFLREPNGSKWDPTPCSLTS